MRKHVQILGILNIVWGAVGLMGAIIVMLVFGGAAGIIGLAAGHESGAGIAIPIVGVVGGFIFLILLITSLPAILAGVGLLQFASWGRILAIIVSALHLLNLPFGTALGIYGLWVLVGRETSSLFGSGGGPVRI
jgi:hypothetical protein